MMFSIYDSPFSDETKIIRRNSLLVSGLSLFIGLSGNLPEKFALLGVSFSTDQQNVLGWFIFSVTLYLFLHFLSVASIEIAQWIHPFYAKVLTEREALKSPAFNEMDFIETPTEIDKQNPDDIYAQAQEKAEWHTKKKLKILYNFIYLKLIIEALAPIVIGVWGLCALFQLITINSS